MPRRPLIASRALCWRTARTACPCWGPWVPLPGARWPGGPRPRGRAGPWLPGTAASASGLCAGPPGSAVSPRPSRSALPRWPVCPAAEWRRPVPTPAAEVTQ
eukprot:3146675-Alexandrium_andersonii.AAC.1